MNISLLAKEEEKVFFDQDNYENVSSKEWGWYQFYDKEEYKYNDIDP